MRPHRRRPTRLLHPWNSPGKNTGVGCHFLLLCMKVKSKSEVTQSWMGAIPLHRLSYGPAASSGTHFLQHHSLASDMLQNWDKASPKPVWSEVVLIVSVLCGGEQGEKCTVWTLAYPQQVLVSRLSTWVSILVLQLKQVNNFSVQFPHLQRG